MSNYPKFNWGYCKSYDLGAFWARSGASWTDVLYMANRSDDHDNSVSEWARGYFGTPPAVHFVGFRGDEYARATKVWGKPDFIHRMMDPRLVLGGELAPHDTVVIANGYENRTYLNSHNDSEHF